MEKQFYIIYKEKQEDAYCKYHNQKATKATEALISFEEQFPTAIFMVMYDLSVNDVAICRKDS